MRGFYKIQQCINNNIKPYATIYIWNHRKTVYQKKLKLEVSLLHDVMDHVICLCFLFNAKMKKKRFLYFITPENQYFVPIKPGFTDSRHCNPS